ncbi:hypothetical protein [Streptacidiphilus cavernicola]|uniref:Translation initiation factor 2 n=1 Tax=Streptacidiphilus cavernicola TaxID=3342716 RepID=A0ABV6VWM4_9ACTN
MRADVAEWRGLGADAPRWRTFTPERRLLVAARTVTSAVRALEVLPLLVRGDPRVDVVFAYDPGSAFHHGVLDLLHEHRCRVLPWHQIGEADPHLVLSASENLDLPDGDCPLLVLPHGIGFQKQVPDSRGPLTRLSGLVPERLLPRTWLAVSHPDELRQLAALDPRAAERAVELGDPCFERLRAGLGSRPAYRAALGVQDRQRLVVLSSTWGPTSLLGRDPALPSRLLAQLPLDGYRVALVTHPNVSSWHGSWQLDSLQADAVAAGLALVPPTAGWQAAVTAADVLVGDHGSVTLYGAALGRPVLLAAFGSDAVPGTAGSLLRHTAPHLDPDRPLAGQLASAVHDHRPEQGRRLAERAFGYGEGAVDRLRETLYGLLKLSEPDALVPRLAFPVPRLTLPRPPAALVDTTCAPSAQDPLDQGRAVVEVRRRPAAVSAADREPPPRDGFRHLSCAQDEPDLQLLHSASVVHRAAPAATAVAARRWALAVLEDFPGCRLAAVPVDGGFLLSVRGGRLVRASVTGGGADPGLVAAALYSCLRAGIRVDDVTVELRVGDRELDVALRALP